MPVETRIIAEPVRTAVFIACYTS